MTFKDGLKEAYLDFNKKNDDKELERKMIHDFLMACAKEGYDTANMGLTELDREILKEEGFTYRETDNFGKYGERFYIINLID